jgi:hypothetical protein
MVAFPGFILLFGLLLWVVPAVGVYVHASNRGRDALLWAIVTLVAGLVGVLLYVLLAGSGEISTGRGRETRSCPQCGHSQPAERDYCTDCGAHLWVDCPECGRKTSPNHRYCPDCGAEIGSDTRPQH